MAAHTPKSQPTKSDPHQTASAPDTPKLTETVSIGRFGREWKLPFEATLSRTPDSTGQRQIEISTPQEAVVIRQTCEFLREHAPQTYARMWIALRAANPVGNQHHADIKRVARDVVAPYTGEENHQPGLPKREDDRKSPVTVTIPEISKSHWAYKRHYNVGNYITARSGDPKTLAEAEAKSDIQSILSYIERYRDLAKEVTGKNLWRATHEPGFRDPYFTCMELCVGEAQVPSHMLALIHYGIGIQMMYELSLPWNPPKSMSQTRREILDSCKDSFRALARLYREDFC